MKGPGRPSYEVELMEGGTFRVTLHRHDGSIRIVPGFASAHEASAFGWQMTRLLATSSAPQVAMAKLPLLEAGTTSHNLLVVGPADRSRPRPTVSVFRTELDQTGRDRLRHFACTLKTKRPIMPLSFLSKPHLKVHHDATKSVRAN